MSDQEHAHDGHHRNYVKIWAILLVLLVVSVLGPMLEIQIVTLITAFGIATVKAYLVVKNFMHLDVEKPIVHWILITAVVFMVLFWGGTAADIMKPDGQNWVKDAPTHVAAGAHGEAPAAEAAGGH